MNILLIMTLSCEIILCWEMILVKKRQQVEEKTKSLVDADLSIHLYQEKNGDTLEDSIRQ